MKNISSSIMINTPFTKVGPIYISHFPLKKKPQRYIKFSIKSKVLHCLYHNPHPVQLLVNNFKTIYRYFFIKVAQNMFMKICKCDSFSIK